MTKNGTKGTKKYEKQAVLKFSRRIVYRVENDEIGRKEIRKDENNQIGTKWGLQAPKGVKDTLKGVKTGYKEDEMNQKGQKVLKMGLEIFKEF